MTCTPPTAEYWCEGHGCRGKKIPATRVGCGGKLYCEACAATRETCPECDRPSGKERT